MYAVRMSTNELEQEVQFDEQRGFAAVRRTVKGMSDVKPTCVTVEASKFADLLDGHNFLEETV